MEIDGMSMLFEMLRGVWPLMKWIATISPPATVIVFGVVGLKLILHWQNYK